MTTWEKSIPFRHGRALTNMCLVGPSSPRKGLSRGQVADMQGSCSKYLIGTCAVEQVEWQMSCCDCRALWASENLTSPLFTELRGRVMESETVFNRN